MWKELIQFICEKLKLMTARHFNRRIVRCFVICNDSSVVFYLLSNRIMNFRNENLFRICSLNWKYAPWCERHAYSLKCNPLSLDGSIEWSIKDIRAHFLPPELFSCDSFSMCIFYNLISFGSCTKAFELTTLHENR